MQSKNYVAACSLCSDQFVKKTKLHRIRIQMQLMLLLCVRFCYEFWYCRASNKCLQICCQNTFRWSFWVAFLPEDDRNPIIMPNEHHFTTLLVSATHWKRFSLQRNWISHYILVRGVRNDCRGSVRSAELIMGHRPIDQINPFVFPFTHWYI